MAFPVKEDGTLGEGKVLYDATKLVGDANPGLPDGLAVDVSGNIWRPVLAAYSYLPPMVKSLAKF